MWYINKVNVNWEKVNVKRVWRWGEKLEMLGSVEEIKKED